MKKEEVKINVVGRSASGKSCVNTFHLKFYQLLTKVIIYY
jgi:hypothetical protein